MTAPDLRRGELTTLVEAQRGLTDDEILRLLTTGEVPDLPVDPDELEPEPVAETGLTEDEALALLSSLPVVAAGGAGAPAEVTFKFDPNQRRDSHGRWSEAGGGDGGSADALVGAAALEAAPVSIANTRHEMRCRPETLAICGGDQRRRKERAGSLLEYRSTSYQDINNLLRHGFTDDYPENQVRDWVDQIDQIMQSSRLDGDVITMRGMIDATGIFGDAFEGDDDLTGFEWTEDAFVSTTADPDIADYFGEGLVMHIRVPRGTGAVQLSRFSGDGYTDEAELLLERGLRMRVVGDRGRDRMNRRVLDVEVVPA